MSQSRVLVTGCSGYIGWELVGWLRRRGWWVCGWDRRAVVGCNEFEMGDIMESDRSPFEYGFDVIIHLAGASKIDEKLNFDYDGDNVVLTQYVAEMFPEVPFILSSTTSMLNEEGQVAPVHAYSRTKLEAEKIADYSYRFGTVCGANGEGAFHGVVDCMIHSAMLDSKIYVAGGLKSRPLVALHSVCGMLEQAARDVYFEGADKVASMSYGVDCVATMDEMAKEVVSVLGMMGHHEDIKIVHDENLSGLDEDRRKSQGWISSRMARGFKGSPGALTRLVLGAVSRYLFHVRGYQW